MTIHVCITNPSCKGLRCHTVLEIVDGEGWHIYHTVNIYKNQSLCLYACYLYIPFVLLLVQQNLVGW